MRRRSMLRGSTNSANVAYAYTGVSVDHGIVEMIDGNYRLIEISSGGTLQFSHDVIVDIWMCNGGNGGMENVVHGPSFQEAFWEGGAGGAGGRIAQMQAVPIEVADIAIGEGGKASTDNSSPTCGGQTCMVITDGDTVAPPAQTTALAHGASGGGRSVYSAYNGYGFGEQVGSGTGDNCYPFGDNTLFDLHCSGGGSGATFYSPARMLCGEPGGENGSCPSNASPTVGTSGGTGGSGAGDGGTATSPENASGKDATRYGCGGGGAAAMRNQSTGFGYSVIQSGNGYPGVVYVRIPA